MSLLDAIRREVPDGPVRRAVEDHLLRPHTFEGVVLGTPSRPCQRCGQTDRAAIHARKWTTTGQVSQTRNEATGHIYGARIEGVDGSGSGWLHQIAMLAADGATVLVSVEVLDR